MTFILRFHIIEFLDVRNPMEQFRSNIYIPRLHQIHSPFHGLVPPFMPQCGMKVRQIFSRQLWMKTS
jgi:hypothetical protein